MVHGKIRIGCIRVQHGVKRNRHRETTHIKSTTKCNGGFIRIDDGGHIMLNPEKIKATAICLTALRVIQAVDYISRNKNATKIANAIHIGTRKFGIMHPTQMELTYTIELNVAKKVETELGKIEIEATALIVFLLQSNRELIDKHFKMNWNIVEKLMNLRWSNPHSKLSMIKNATQYSKDFAKILDVEMIEVDRIMVELLQKRKESV